MNTTTPGWHPPHCPNPNCKYHNGNCDTWQYVKTGFHYKRTRPHRIQRFTCKHCNRSFSTQTFSVTYWLKRPDVLIALMTKTVGGMANRQTGTDLQAASTTCDRQISRLGRHSMLFHRQRFENAPPPGEIAVDGFEAFELSQYFPTHFHIAIDPNNSFFYHFTDSELRRKGRMTDAQKKKRQENEETLGKPDPKAVEKDMGELVTTVLKGAVKATIRSDLHKAYPRAFKTLDCEVVHRTVSSRDYRDRHNLLWEINRADRMIRHSQSGHMRETLAWPKRRQCAAERLAIFVVWWNYARKRWVKGKTESPAMLRGLTDRVWTVREILSERIFATRLELPERWEMYYRSEVQTRALEINKRHELKYAF